MILAYLALLGLAIGVLRVLSNPKLQLEIPDLRWMSLVPIAFLPQLFAFYLPSFGPNLGQQWSALGLVISQLLLLVFVCKNWRLTGFLMLGLGLALNLVVITANGGLMPITPVMAAALTQTSLADVGEIGQSLATTKDIILPKAETTLWFLSDRFFFAFPAGMNYRIAFSLGDVLISLGAFWFAWRLGQPTTVPTFFRLSLSSTVKKLPRY